VRRRVGILVAISPEGAIGLDGRIPWHHPGDMRRFKRLTLGKTVIMGRSTWESLPKRPLPERRNIVLTSRSIEGVESFKDLASALATCDGEVWIVGGARAYAEGMRFADFIDVTYVPDHVTDPRAVTFPPIDPAQFIPGELVAHEDEPELARRVFTKRPPRD
jgi:dihydrofolate reductase